MDCKKLLEQMTLRQKLAQMTQLMAPLLSPEVQMEATGPMTEMGLTAQDVAECGSVLGFNSAEERIALQKQHMDGDPNHIPLLFMQDVIHGYRTLYPIALGMAASFDPSLVKACAAMAAREAAVSGVDVAFSPMVDIARDARWGRCMEGAGEDTHLGCVMAKAQVEGYLQGEKGTGVAACVKHFAGYGATQDGKDYNTVELSPRTFRQDYLPPYKAALDAGARFVMPSFNTVDGIPSVGNRALMVKLLREMWGFDGVVVSDFGAVGELITHGVAETPEDAAVLAMNAACDLEMMTTGFLHGVEKAIADGRLTMAQVDASVLRILREKDAMGLFDQPMGNADPEAAKTELLSPAHRALARRAAEETSVLLKNDGLLPLCDEVKKVAVIGPFGDVGTIIGSWAVNGRAEDAVTIAQGMREHLPKAEVRVVRGCGDGLNEAQADELAQAVEAAQWADEVILCLGEEGEQSGESKCRANLTLSPAQLALFDAVSAANACTAVLLLTGRPLAIPQLAHKAHAILCMWQPGTEGGHAAARLLFGDVAPSGRLPMTFPRTTGQEPIFYAHKSTGRQALNPDHCMDEQYRTRYIDCPVTPQYPFGYGLTYTSFAYENAELSANCMTAQSSIIAKVTVRNTGKRAGSEVVQLYVHDLFGSVTRPVRELKGFSKVTLAAGEAREVSFEITEEMLRFITANDDFASEPGDFEVYLAPDAQSGTALRFRLEK